MSTIERIKEIAEQYKNAPVECDGMTRILHHYFQKEQIVHRTWIGTIIDTVSKNVFSPHFWITCDTEEGEVIVDYRSRFWLGESVTQGVFLKKEHPEVKYDGKEIVLSDLSEGIIQAMLLPISLEDAQKLFGEEYGEKKNSL